MKYNLLSSSCVTGINSFVKLFLRTLVGCLLTKPLSQHHDNGGRRAQWNGKKPSREGRLTIKHKFEHVRGGFQILQVDDHFGSANKECGLWVHPTNIIV